MIKKIVNIVIGILLACAIAGNIYLLCNFVSRKELNSTREQLGAATSQLQACSTSITEKDKTIADLQAQITKLKKK